MLEGIGWLVKGIAVFFASIKGFLPQSFLGFFILIQFFVNWVNQGIVVAFTEFSKAILSAEYIIYENVTLAIEGSNYTLFSFIEIIVSLMVLFYLVKMIAFIIRFFTNGGSREFNVLSLGVYFIALCIVFIIELSVVRLVVGDFSFIPFYSGLLYLFMNLEPVLSFKIL